MELIPENAGLPKLYEQDGKGDNAIAYLHLFNPAGGQDWFIIEYDPEQRLAFGYASLFNDYNNEFGYISLDELENITLPFGLKIERDLHFEPCTIKEACQKKGIYYEPIDES